MKCESMCQVQKVILSDSELRETLLKAAHTAIQAIYDALKDRAEWDSIGLRLSHDEEVIEVRIACDPDNGFVMWGKVKSWLFYPDYPPEEYLVEVEIDYEYFTAKYHVKVKAPKSELQSDLSWVKEFIKNYFTKLCKWLCEKFGREFKLPKSTREIFYGPTP